MPLSRHVGVVTPAIWATGPDRAFCTAPADHVSHPVHALQCRSRPAGMTIDLHSRHAVPGAARLHMPMTATDFPDRSSVVTGFPVRGSREAVRSSITHIPSSK